MKEETIDENPVKSVIVRGIAVLVFASILIFVKFPATGNIIRNTDTTFQINIYFIIILLFIGIIIIISSIKNIKKFIQR